MAGQDLVTKFGSTYPENTMVFREGDMGNEMYIIHTGEVKILKKAKNAEQVLAVLNDGDFFGEMALFTDQKRSATATVTQKSVLLRIDKTSFEYMILNKSDFAMNLIRTLCERLRKTDQQIEELLVLSRETRVMKAMESYWRLAGQKASTGDSLVIPYDGFLDYCRKNLGIGAVDTKQILLKLKNQDLLHIRKDVNEQIFIVFSPKVFSYLEVI